MKKKKLPARDVLVEENQFDSVLSQLLKMGPMPMKKIKPAGRKGSKTQLFPPRKSES